MCRTPQPNSYRTKKKHVHVVEDSSDSTDYELYAGMIHDLPLNSVNPLNDEWVVNSEINDKTVNFQIDTGARCNVMSQDTFHSFGIKTALKPTSTKLTSFSGHKLKPILIVQLWCKKNKVTILTLTFTLSIHLCCLLLVVPLAEKQD